MELRKYNFLISELVIRDFKLRYKRSVLGVLWSFLSPLLTMMVQYVVFSRIFRSDIQYYAVYLLTGIILFKYFSECCNVALCSVVSNASLIKKVYVPKYIYPLTRVLSSLINLLISVVLLFIVTFISGLRPTFAYILALYPIICMTFFCLGLGMMLATSMVFFRDTQFLWGVVVMMWTYLTPIFYPANILPDEVSWILKLNPLCYFIDFFRTCIIDGKSPELSAYFACFAFAVVVFAAGLFVFTKKQDDFVLYI